MVVEAEKEVELSTKIIVLLKELDDHLTKYTSKDEDYNNDSKYFLKPSKKDK